MIPILVADELRETVLDYLDTTFAFRDRAVADALRTFLVDPVEGIFKGPYVHLRLPFRRGEKRDVEPWLDVHPPFTPYLHQIRAFQRLTTKDHRQPDHTLVTTGTGSGKTECFLYPLLDHCAREKGQKGIKALVLYPMNALASDQARRLAKEIAKEPQLEGVRAGLFVGGKGHVHKTMGSDHVITDRDTLRRDPPDILLTNYKMLDYLLMRPEDQKIWKDTGPETLRYLILDELHTYDGAQGSDVACLIRRLKAKLQCKPSSLCFVGTSATLASGGNTQRDLLDFARKLLGEPLKLDSVITEDRLNLSEYLDGDPRIDALPSPNEGMRVRLSDSLSEYTARQTRLWFESEDLDPVRLGELLRDHVFLRSVLLAFDGKAREWSNLLDRVAKQDPEFAALSGADREHVLKSFLALISSASQVVEGRSEPFLQMQVQLWIREMSRLMREVSEEPRFSWFDGSQSTGHAKSLPPVYCRECGHTGWVTRRAANSNQCETDYARIRDAFFDRDRRTTYLFVDADKESGLYVNSELLSLSDDRSGVPVCDPDLSQSLTQVTDTARIPKDKHWCPLCESDGALTIVGSQAASLSSVLVSHLYASRFNTDKKLLAFTDSVQDASHRAAFFGARTFRFNLRTAIQTVLESSGDPPTLAELPELVTKFWRGAFLDSEKERNLRRAPEDQLDLEGVAYRAAQRFVATFTPPDLQELAEYKAFVHRGMRNSMKHALAAVERRLAWEICMEYGLNARVGRTLDKTLCSTAWFDTPQFDVAVEKVIEALREMFVRLAEVPTEQIRHFIAGFLMRTKLRGGIFDQLLDKYVAEGGRAWWLYKNQNRFMSPFAPDTPRPKFLSLKPFEKDFDSVLARGNYQNWYSDWLQRSLFADIDTAYSNDVYRELLPLLAAHGLLKQHAMGPDVYFGIDPDSLLVCCNPEACRSEDGDDVVLAPGEFDRWTGQASLTFRGQGVFDHRPDQRDHFYRSIYRSGNVERIYCSEHTSLLDRDKRESVETGFKDAPAADSPNLLACSPTLEMGIDVGDLSSTMVCSIPPTPTNYLQRIGRAGRSTGNALIMAIANVRPHDLYYYEDPFEMIAGDVVPPGCFLDAPEMLKRQFTAFAMDTWCSTGAGDKLPRRVGLMLGSYRAGGFPRPFLDFQERNRDELLAEFLKQFGDEISPEGRERLTDFASSGALGQTFENCLYELEEELRELRNARGRLVEQKRKLEASGNTIENAADLIKEIDSELKVLYRLLDDASSQYPLNLFVERGVLPNYDLSEAGVKLKSVITGVEVPDAHGRPTFEPQSAEYVRGASVAIREFAPLNTFYVEERKLVIDQVETGGTQRSGIQDWKLCPECSHIQLAALDDGVGACPKCGAPGFRDLGQKRPMLHLKKVSSRADSNLSKALDTSDDRESTRYLLRDYFDVLPDSYGGGFVNEAASFGFEYLRRVTLREVNFGPADIAFGGKFRTAGEEIRDHGFPICRDCGVIDPMNPSTSAKHRYWCRLAQGQKASPFTNLFLFREMESEAIRFLLPLSTLMAEEKSTTLKAALNLGLRLRFGGRPSHLLIKRQTEPEAGVGAGIRNYLVLYDSVPGGTGYLKEFVKDSSKLKDVFERALKALKTCVCQRKPGADGCYRCVYAYQNQRDMKLISRTLGISLLEEILGAWDGLVQTDSLSTIRISDSLLESELEQRFIAVLGERLEQANGTLTKVVSKGKPCYDLSLNGYVWRVEPQVVLDSSYEVYPPSRADFVFWPREETPEAVPIALFTDGFRYHVCPDEDQSRIPDDVEKRSAILSTGRFNVWTLTWRDLETDDQSQPRTLNDWGATLASVNRLAQPFKLKDAAWAFTGSLEQLLAQLGDPDQPSRRRTIDAAAFAATATCPLESGEARRIALDLGDGKTNIDPKPNDVSAKTFGKIVERRDSRMAIGVSVDGTDAVAHLGAWIATSAVSRTDADYEQSWREYWSAFNLMARQDNFYPGPKESARAKGPRPSQSIAPPVSTELSSSLADSHWREAASLARLEIRGLIETLAVADLPVPEVGYELCGSDGFVIGEAELAWPGAKVSVFVAADSEDEAEFQKAGWTVFCHETGLDPTELIRVVRR